ncbi:MAG: histone deacetylase [Planctomycetes bacterium]|nr:histone deacetylase [Planctomycetota bacterium]
MALLYTDSRFLEHETGTHPESAARLQAVHARLAESGLGARFEPGEIRPATKEQLQRVHNPDYIEAMAEMSLAGGGRPDIDTVVSDHSYDVAVDAAGAAVAAVEQVIAGPHRVAICLVRPPGHHALSDRAMGFCLFNSIAVAARHARDALGLSRVLIVDWDVHHGNGTQDTFYSDGTVHFLSAHRYPFYPGTGPANETGRGPGLGANYNLPLSFGTSRASYLRQFQNLLERAAERSRPELVLVSAGFDAHHADPIGSLGLETEDFIELTGMVHAVAATHAAGRLVSLLEGGYNVQALADCVQVHLETLLVLSRDATEERH